MNKFHYLLIALVVGGLSLVVLASNGFFNSQRQAKKIAPAEVDQPDIARVVEPPSLPDALGVSGSDMVEVGGVLRPKKSVSFDDSPVAVASSKSVLPHPGNAPAIDRSANAEVAGLIDELSAENGGPSEVRSALFPPEPFDQAEYDRDPKAWLTKIRPGRAFQTAQPGPEVRPIVADSPAFSNVLQGEQVTLRAKVKSGTPVTFYTSQLGEFGNRLTTRSVAADENGIATATYTATPGTQGVVNILAASPVNSGQLRFQVRVSLPTEN